MLDSHIYPENWGIMPILFTIGGFRVQSYSFFMLMALIVGVVYYCLDTKKSGSFNENAFYIFIAAFVFGTIGAKLPTVIANYKLIFSDFGSANLLLSGKTIVGGLIGGTIGVFLTKKFLGIKVRMGNQIAPAAAIGMAIGRIGCFLRGCCYGVPTNASYGVNFGDGVLRHPTQLYEFVFDIAAFIYLLRIRKNVNEPGALFRAFLNLYFAFRFMIEFIRVEQVVLFGLTGFQLATLIVLVYVNRKAILNVFRERKYKNG